ncbi:MAG: DsbA family oxidoreductase [Proteobacteria bacterium]|nr:DsbA family oxidoreductase [Pseudomonadota bacterium]
MSGMLSIEVYFDFICPWCLIGKRNLERALATFRGQHPGTPVRIDWRPYELLPSTPRQGIPYQHFYLQRLGSALAVEARRAQVRSAADAAGVQLDFEKIQLMPNTRAAHALVEQARGLGETAVAALIEDAFSAYFQRGEDIGDPATLTRLADTHGLPPGRHDGDALPSAGSPTAFVPGVPYFVFPQRVALSGAQPPETLLRAMIRAAAPAGEFAAS